MSRLAIVALCLLIVGCRSREASLADDRILWSAEGCAFIVRGWDIGANSVVVRLPDADKPTCDQPERVR